ncbi:MAG TPA: VanZ family protein [Opitutaceae bacterium]|nr:VanZ family protein [Opitutaceae bacterium]
MTTLAVQNDFPVSKRQWIWPLAMAALIFAASSRSHLGGPAVAGIDKVTHFAVYGLLATLVVRLGRGSRAAWLSVLVVSLYGLSDEWHQSFTPGRSVELADWLADTGGAALAVAMYSGWTWYRKLLEAPVFRTQRRVENAATPATVSSR